MAAYGSSVCARLTASEAARYYEGLGYRVVGAVNGDFYDTATGYPLGILISAGQLLSGASSYYAVGFRQHGYPEREAGLPQQAPGGQGGHHHAHL